MSFLHNNNKNKPTQKFSSQNATQQKQRNQSLYSKYITQGKDALSQGDYIEAERHFQSAEHCIRQVNVIEQKEGGARNNNEHYVNNASTELNANGQFDHQEYDSEHSESSSRKGNRRRSPGEFNAGNQVNEGQCDFDDAEGADGNVSYPLEPHENTPKRRTTRRSPTLRDQNNAGDAGHSPTKKRETTPRRTRNPST
ncbi:MAG: DUF4167 domain-containing protein [Holosporales bacterium]|jgi:hypothetical protein|nr:DUF4167 domain-containing protein [Holosporales bacterium]